MEGPSSVTFSELELRIRVHCYRIYTAPVRAICTLKLCCCFCCMERGKVRGELEKAFITRPGRERNEVAEEYELSVCMYRYMWILNF